MNDSRTADTHPNRFPATPRPSKANTRAPTRLVVALLFLGGASPSAIAANGKTEPPTRAEVAEKKDDLKEIQGQIKALQKGVAEARDKRSDAADKLKRIEQEISATQRSLHDLAQQRSKLQASLTSLVAQSRELETRLSHQHEQLGRLVYRQYLQGNPLFLQFLRLNCT